MKRPAVWQMVKEAIEEIGSDVSREDIKKYIYNKWNDIKDHTIICQIQVLTVNHPSRINYSMNKKPRLTTSNCRYDFCYQTTNKKLEKYDIAKHGTWEIYETAEIKLSIRSSIEHTEDTPKSIWQLFSEGSPNQVIQTRYERNPGAREACIEYYGYLCFVCSFNFEERYGELGRNFIHIHHLNPLSNSKKIHQVDPIMDLRPVCPNCHSMLHRNNPPLAIEDLKKELR